MDNDNALLDDIKRMSALLRERNMMLGTAESCTGGLIGSTLTDISGSSGWYAGGVVSYSNRIKESLLHVSPETLERYGAVSEQTVREMAVGACSALVVDAAMAVSGVAGPTGGSPEKPVGTVWIAWALPDLTGRPAVEAERHLFSGDRGAIKAQTVGRAVRGLLERLERPVAREVGP